MRAVVVDQRALSSALACGLLSAPYTRVLFDRVKQVLDEGSYVNFHTGERELDPLFLQEVRKLVAAVPLGGRHNWQRMQDFRYWWSKAIKEI